MSRSLSLSILAVGVLLAACQASGSPSAPPAESPTVGAGVTPSATVDEAAAERWCTDQGGALVDRVPVWNTNADPQAWLQLAGRMRLCEFQSGTGDQATRTSVDLLTLYSAAPTLAGIAYLSKVPPKLPSTPSANPALAYCSESLGATATFGSGASGGGWVDTAQPVFKVMDLCVFADASTIDAFGLLYHASGTIRGADLATKMRYQPDGKLPAVFAP